MALEFKLPDIGEGIAEGEIVQWLVSAGQEVAEHEPVVEVMTDKATVEVPSPAPGTITELRASAGEVVPVGSVIFVLDTGGAAAVPAPVKPAEAPAPEATGAQEAAVTGGGRLEFLLPDIGEGIAEGEIVQWLVGVGEEVTEHQPVVEVMTDKATVEVPAPASGRIAELRAEAGQVVPVGSVVYVLETVGAPAAAPAPAPAPALAAAPAPAPAPAPASVTVAPQPDPATPVAKGNGRVLAVPSARRVARELGVDISLVSGTGRNGVVRRRDVEEFHASGRVPAPVSVAPAVARPVAVPVGIPAGERETREPFRGVRRKIAEAMTRSKFTATHFTVVEELDVTELVRVRAQAKAMGAEQGVKVTYTSFIMKAVASGLARYPQLNCSLDESSQEVVTYHYVNLGIATDTDNGLIVPVIPDVQSKGVLQIAAELQELAARTREGKVRPEELQGGTFTITNAGNIGGTLATPIINFPEVAILGVHRIQKKPGVVETPEGDRIEVRHYMNLSISIDHRLADGADGVRFLVHLKRLLESPGLLAL